VKQLVAALAISLLSAFALASTAGEQKGVSQSLTDTFLPARAEDDKLRKRPFTRVSSLLLRSSVRERAANRIRSACWACGNADKRTCREPGQEAIFPT
jgi:hypothetical protein